MFYSYRPLEYRICAWRPGIELLRRRPNGEGADAACAGEAREASEAVRDAAAADHSGQALPEGRERRVLRLGTRARSCGIEDHSARRMVSGATLWAAGAGRSGARPQSAARAWPVCGAQHHEHRRRRSRIPPPHMANGSTHPSEDTFRPEEPDGFSVASGFKSDPTLRATKTAVRAGTNRPAAKSLIFSSSVDRQLRSIANCHVGTEVPYPFALCASRDSASGARASRGSARLVMRS